MKMPLGAAGAKGTRSVEVLLSAIQAAAKNSLSSSRTAPNTAPLAGPEETPCVCGGKAG